MPITKVFFNWEGRKGMKNREKNVFMSIILTLHRLKSIRVMVRV